MFKRRTITVVLVSMFVLGLLVNASADIPKVVNYQGKVTDTGGIPIADGAYTMRFWIYNAETGGSPEWDSGDVSVDVSGGIFEVLLGESPQDSIDLTFDEDCWLEVEVAGDIQSPRVKLGSVAYAYMASGLLPGTLIQGSVTTGTSAALKGENTVTTGPAFGLYGQIASIEGSAVYGYASATTGSPVGVFGQSNSPGGSGVYGSAASGHGSNVGVHGRSTSTSGRGVCGEAIAGSGTTYGVYGWSASTDGFGFYGEATASSGYTFGVYGRSASTSGFGVYGEAYASSGTTYGMYGYSASTSGSGVHGRASASSGTTYGVYGLSHSTSGHGVYGEAFTSTGTNYGIYGESQSSSGYGIFGSNPGGWAGGFDGDVDLNGRLVLPDNDATGVAGSGSIEIGNSLRIDGNEIITDTDAILYLQRDNNGDLQIDSNTLVVDASTDRVGIGTSAPDATLHVNGQMRLGAGFRAFEVREVTPSDSWGSGIVSYGGIGIGSNDGTNRQMVMFTDGSGSNNIFTVVTSENNGASWEADFIVQQNGRVGIGTDSPGFALQVGNNGDGTEARANAWNLLSSRKYKSDITPLEQSEYSEILEQLVETDVVRYRFYQDENETQHLGLIAEDAPRDIVTRDGEALSLSDYCAFLLAATKAQ